MGFCATLELGTHTAFFIFFFIVKEFLMLEEITKTGAALPQEEKEAISVEIQDLVCYWDKVRNLILSGIQ